MIVDNDKKSCDRLTGLLNKIPSVKILAIEQEADKAIEKIKALSPDIVFMEIEMPHRSGFEILKEIQAQALKTKCIFVTEQSQYSIKAIRSGAFDYLIKPVDIEELKFAIQRAVLDAGRLSKTL